MDSRRKLLNSFSEDIVNNNPFAMPGLSIIETTLRNRYATHLFQAKRLRRQLDAIPILYFRLPYFVFHGSYRFPPLDTTILHDIGNAIESQPKARHTHTSLCTKPARRCITLHIDAFMKTRASNSVDALCPLLLQMDEGPLSLTIRHMLKPRKRQQVLIAIHFQSRYALGAI